MLPWTPWGSVTLTTAGGFMPPPFRVRAAARYKYLVRTTISTIRMTSTTTPIPNSLAGEPPAGPRRRSYTPTRRLGRCEDEGSGIWRLLIATVNLLRSGGQPGRLRMNDGPGDLSQNETATRQPGSSEQGGLRIGG